MRHHHKIILKLSLGLDFSQIWGIKRAQEYYKLVLNSLCDLICDVISCCV